MIIKSEISLEKFEAWNEAADTLNRVIKEGKCNELENMLENSHPDGMTDKELNDLLWHCSDEVFEWLGISTDDEVKEMTEDVAVSKESTEQTIAVDLSLFGGRIDCFKFALQYALDIEEDMSQSNFTEGDFREILDEVVKLEDANKETEDMGFDLHLVSYSEHHIGSPYNQLEAARYALELTSSFLCDSGKPDLAKIYRGMLKEIEEKESQSKDSIDSEKNEVEKTMAEKNTSAHAHRRRSR